MELYIKKIIILYMKTRRVNKKRKHKKRKNTFKKANCAPNPENKFGFTCYTKKSLEMLRNLWNARHPDCRINNVNPRDIWRSLKHYMRETCKIESCWLKKQFFRTKLNSDLLNYTFAPKSPDSWKRNPTEWLSSVDILNVMKQYEKKFSCFDFIGPSPINYDTHIVNNQCVWEELCEFNICNYIKNGRFKIAIIFNLDPHYKSGSHWVALFIHTKKKEIMFFDSYGEKPHKQIQKFMNNVCNQSKEINITFKQKINTTRHQYGNSECGMYSLHFIIEMLYDKEFDKFNRTKISDSMMIDLRNRYFNSEL